MPRPNQRDQFRTGLWEQKKTPDYRMLTTKVKGEDLKDLATRIDDVLNSGAELAVVLFINNPATKKTPESPDASLSFEKDDYNLRQGGGGGGQRSGGGAQPDFF